MHIQLGIYMYICMCLSPTLVYHVLNPMPIYYIILQEYSVTDAIWRSARNSAGPGNSSQSWNPVVWPPLRLSKNTYKLSSQCTVFSLLSEFYVRPALPDIPRSLWSNGRTAPCASLRAKSFHGGLGEFAFPAAFKKLWRFSICHLSRHMYANNAIC